MPNIGTILLIAILSLQCQVVSAQKSKEKLDSAAFFSWPRIETHTIQISEAGKYLYYKLTNTPSNIDSTIIQSLSSSERIVFTNTEKLEFADDDASVVYLDKVANLSILNLHDSSHIAVAGVEDFKVLPSGEFSLVACRKDNGKQLDIYDLHGSLKFSYDNVEQVIYGSDCGMYFLYSVKYQAIRL